MGFSKNKSLVVFLKNVNEFISSVNNNRYVVIIIVNAAVYNK